MRLAQPASNYVSQKDAGCSLYLGDEIYIDEHPVVAISCRPDTAVATVIISRGKEGGMVQMVTFSFPRQGGHEPYWTTELTPESEGSDPQRSPVLGKGLMVALTLTQTGPHSASSYSEKFSGDNGWAVMIIFIFKALSCSNLHTSPQVHQKLYWFHLYVWLSFSDRIPLLFALPHSLNVPKLPFPLAHLEMLCLPGF